MCVFATGIPWDLWGSGGILVSVGILELSWAQQAISATGIPWDLWGSGGILVSVGILELFWAQQAILPGTRISFETHPNFVRNIIWVISAQILRCFAQITPKFPEIKL